MDALPTSRWDAAVEVLLAALFLFSPFALGGVEPWSEGVILVLVAAAAACLGMRLLVRRDMPFLWTWTYLPILLFIGLVSLQLAPLPAVWAGRLSPQTLGTKTALVGDLPGAAEYLKQVTLSFYPLGTRDDLRIVLYAAGVYVIVLNVYRRPAQVRRLLATVAAVGGVAAALSLYQVAALGGERNWAVGLSDATSVSVGLFQSGNHLSQYLNLSVGAAVGLLLMLLQTASREDEWDDVPPWRLAGRLGQSGSWASWLLVVVILLGMLGVAASKSRGGTVATAVALVATLALLFAAGAGGRGWVIGLVAVAAFGGLLYFGFDALYDRFVTAKTDQLGGRTPMWRDMTVLIRRFPVLGTGLGTHEFVFPMVDRSFRLTVPTRGENDYLQLLEETGVAGAMLFIAFMVLLGGAFARAVRGTRDALGSGAFGLGFGLLAVMVHSLTDFGQHLPGIACLSAACCGLLVGMGREKNKTSTTGPQGRPALESQPPAVTHVRAGKAHLVGLAGAVGLAVALVWQLPQLAAAQRAAGWWQRAQSLEAGLAGMDWRGDAGDFERLVGYAAAAARERPADVVYANGRAAYQWRAVEQANEPDFDRLRALAAEVRREAQQIVLLCPTFGPPHSLAGQLETFVLDRPEGVAHIRLGYQLSPNNGEVCLAAGRLEIQEGRPEGALEPFRRAIKLQVIRLSDVIETFRFQADRPDLAFALAENEPDALLALAADLEQTREDGPPPRLDLARQARERGMTLLRAACEAPDAPATLLARVAYLHHALKDDESAARYFQRALTADYNQVGWRLDYAKALLATSNPDAALAEARVCVRLQPNFQAAWDLVDALQK